MKLNAKLIIIMLSLLVLAMMTLFILNQFALTALVNEIQDSSQEISKAIQMSIEDLTSDAETSRSSEELDRSHAPSKKRFSVFSNCSLWRNSHSQTTSTFHPAVDSASWLRASRRRLASSFGTQNS